MQQATGRSARAHIHAPAVPATAAGMEARRTRLITGPAEMRSDGRFRLCAGIVIVVLICNAFTFEKNKNYLGGEQKKFRSPLRYTLRQAVGALTLHTGRNCKLCRQPGKINANGFMLSATRSPVSKNVTHCKANTKILPPQAFL